MSFIINHNAVYAIEFKLKEEDPMREALLVNLGDSPYQLMEKK
ncbi:hypothetical protein LCGC14_0855050 [marine sediment metagenome]|uniref:Uncharacterized protein n=1 Tax=marine sediment metagenome TaxID=412755 RepID=A0A0F9PE16_9ZZZZ